MSTWTVVLAFVVLAIVMMIGAVVTVEIRLRNKRKPVVKAPANELGYLKMYDENTKKYIGKGILCTYEEAMDYIHRWTEADRIVDKVSYIESSHVLGQRPVWGK